MSNQNHPPQITTSVMIDIADEIAQLHHFLEQIEVLAGDLYLSYFERTNMKNKGEKIITEYDFRAARVKADLLHTQTIDALEKAYELRNFSYAVTETARGAKI